MYVDNNDDCYFNQVLLKLRLNKLLFENMLPYLTVCIAWNGKVSTPVCL